MDSYTTFEQLKKAHPFLPLGELVYMFLYNEIIYLRILPNTKLGESKIADELKISRTPVNYALNRLIDEQLIEKKEGKTTVVSTMGKKESKMLYEARIAIEGYAAFLAVSRITGKQLAALEELVKQYLEIGKDINPETYADCDHQFHGIIIEAAGNTYISKMYASIESRLKHYRYCLLSQIGKDRLQPIIYQASKHHRAVYNALRLGFADIARMEMGRDIEGMTDVFYEWK